MEIIWREAALNGLENARRYIAEHNPSAADRIFEAILSSVKRLADMPKIGRPGRVSGTRELVIVGTPYVVAYAVVAKRINIIAVQHGAQEWPEHF
ncbi:MAG TPA: type II toxin-antitoxin system RelE/ParE family toxin [Alphaproteobacteria bacterium]|nr:type II toxin-antitoxin system RelE/ParE family toxin [Alphaproteobacteria bacterium]